MTLLPKLRFNRTSAVDSDVVGRGLFHGPVTQGDPVTLLVLLVMVAPLGCGMKGPPRAPLIVVPGPVTALEIRRFGGEVQVGFTLPTRNQDNTEPAAAQTAARTRQRDTIIAQVSTLSFWLLLLFAMMHTPLLVLFLPPRYH